MHKYDEKMRSLMNERKKFFDRTINKAEKKMINKKYELAAVYAQIASNYASSSHSGFFYSEKVEKILNEISSKVIIKKTNIISNSHIKKVLHVATEIYVVGGHTRLIQNWIEYDPNRTNDLVITNQKEKESPAKIIENFHEKKSLVFYLKDNNKSILSRAQILHDLSKGYDAIILHIHPWDVVPLIAFSHLDVPVLFLNHADHRFWIGRNISNIVLEIRNSGKMLSNKRRDINDVNQAILPIPLKQPIILSKKEARRFLNMREEDILIFSVAASYKYKKLEDNGIEQILLPLIFKFKNIKVIVAGPDLSEEYWKDLYKQSEGKIEAIGMQYSIDYYYIASDLYLDSYPVGSLTSLLDAAKYGVPIFSIAKGTRGLDIDDIALEKIDFKSKSFDDIIERMSYYINRPSKRKEFGVTCLEQVNKYHVGVGWSMFLEDIFAKVNSLNKKKDFINISSDLIEKHDYSLAYMYHKNKSLEYEYISSFQGNFELLPFLDQIIYVPTMLKVFFKNPRFIIKIIIPQKIKNWVKKGIGR